MQCIVIIVCSIRVVVIDNEVLVVGQYFGGGALRSHDITQQIEFFLYPYME